MNTTDNLREIKRYFLGLQDKICHSLEDLEGYSRFSEDVWERKEGGGGITRILSAGKVFERGGVAFSHIYGDTLPSAATLKREGVAGRSFQALGLSLVIHPKNPFVPTSHMNIRFFIAEKQGKPPIWWFGGGYDLTPYYGFDEDARHWHQTAYDACKPFGKDTYTRFKEWCDEYFYIRHRQEQRGIGGIFFDDLNEWGFDQCFSFVRSVGDSFLNAYLPIVKRRKGMSYSNAHREFQLYRRGRYIEYNLVYDRGTLFGLQTGGRTESILMSLPPKVVWKYNWHPAAGTEEALLYEKFLVPKDWLKGED